MGRSASNKQLASLGPFFPGSRIGVLLVHGLAGTPMEMKTVAKRLNRYGFTVLCPQLDGHCATETELIATTWNDWAQSAARAYACLAAHMDVVFVGGLSAGAVLSLYLAQRYPDIRGLALYSTTLRWDGWSIPKLSFLLPLILRLPYFGKRYRFEESYPYGIMNKRLRQRVFAQMQSGKSSEAGLIGTPGASVRELWRMVAAVKKRLPDVATPSLLVHARQDDIASVRNAMYVQKHMRGPTELMLLDHSYHMVTVDQERYAVSDATARFFHNQLTDTEKNELTNNALEPVPQGISDESTHPGIMADEHYRGHRRTVGL